MEALRGRDRAEYERLMSEMARLRESWVSQELARIRAAAREAGLLAQLASVNKVLHSLLHISFTIQLFVKTFCRSAP